MYKNRTFYEICETDLNNNAMHYQCKTSFIIIYYCHVKMNQHPNKRAFSSQFHINIHTSACE